MPAQPAAGEAGVQSQCPDYLELPTCVVADAGKMNSEYLYTELAGCSLERETFFVICFLISKIRK